MVTVWMCAQAHERISSSSTFMMSAIYHVFNECEMKTKSSSFFFSGEVYSFFFFNYYKGVIS